MRAFSWIAANAGRFTLLISLSAAKRDSSLGLSKQNLHKNGVAIGKQPSIEALTCDQPGAFQVAYPRGMRVLFRPSTEADHH